MLDGTSTEPERAQTDNAHQRAQSPTCLQAWSKKASHLPWPRDASSIYVLGFCALAVGGPTQCKSRKPIIMYQSSIRNPRQGHSLFCKRTREPGSNPDSKTGIIAPSHHLVHRSPSKPTINPIPPISSNPPGFIPKSESQTQNLNPRTLTRNQSQTLNPNRCFTSTS